MSTRYTLSKVSKVLVHARIDAKDAEKLERIATKEQRTASWLIALAVKLFVKRK